MKPLFWRVTRDGRDLHIRETNFAWAWRYWHNQEERTRHKYRLVPVYH